MTIPRTPEEINALSPEEREAMVINTYAQIILDLCAAARLPVGLRLVAGMAIALETMQRAFEASMTEDQKKALNEAILRKADAKELYVAHNLGDAVRGGTAKVILTP